MKRGEGEGRGIYKKSKVVGAFILHARHAKSQSAATNTYTQADRQMKIPTYRLINTSKNLIDNNILTACLMQTAGSGVWSTPGPESGAEP